MKNYLLFLCGSIMMISCFTTNNYNQTANHHDIETDNKKLADSLGADENGMKNYMLVILKTGPKDALITDKTQRAELFKGHFSNMEKMEKEGKLKLAGPFSTKNHLNYRGIFILNTTSEDEARALLQNDPTIKIGIFDVEILPWYGSAAIPMHLPYHKQISKKNK